MEEEWSFVTRRSSDLYDVLCQVQDDRLGFDEWLRDKMLSVGLPRSEVIRRSCLNYTFAYQIMRGQRRGSRDKLVQLAIGMGLNICETCELLERGGYARLRANCLRDAAIAFCLARDMEVPACDEVLLRAGMEPLRPDYPNVDD